MADDPGNRDKFYELQITLPSPHVNKMLKSILNSSLFRNISTVFVWDNIVKIIGLVTTVILIRTLPKEDYALYTFFGAALAFFASIVSNGINTSYVRLAAEEYSAELKMSNDLFVFLIFFSLVGFSLLSPLAIFFSKELSQLMFRSALYDKALFWGFIGALALFLTDITSTYYQVQEKFKISGFVIAVQKLLFALFIIGLITFTKLNFINVAFTQIIVSSLCGLVLIILIIKNDLLKNKIVFLRSRFNKFVRVSVWIILYSLTLSLFSQLDIFMISRLKAPDDLANYGVAQKYYLMFLIMLPALKTVLRVRNAKIDMIASIENQKEFVKKWIKVSSVFAIPIVIITLIFSRPIMNLLNGPQYEASILPFNILTISAMFSYIFASNVSILMSMEKSHLLFCFGFAALIINYIGNLWLIPVWGIVGAAISNLFSHLLINGLSTCYVLLKK
jgi:O-antigen/teichoic acid export membrane protein